MNLDLNGNRFIRFKKTRTIERNVAMLSTKSVVMIAMERKTNKKTIIHKDKRT